MAKLTNVSCYYTGGGIWIYEAKYNDEVWIVTDFELSGSYDIPWNEIEGGSENYEEHWKLASVPYPTWKEIARSVRENCPDADIYSIDRLLHQLYIEGAKPSDRIM